MRLGLGNENPRVGRDSHVGPQFNTNTDAVVAHGQIDLFLDERYLTKTDIKRYFGVGWMYCCTER